MNNKICAVSTIKAPVEQVKSWVNYHLNIGIGHMFIFFDNPKDPAISEIKKYKDVTCFRCEWKNKRIPIEDKQRTNSKKALIFARRKNYDWIVHIDSDELIYIKDIKNYLNKIQKKIDVVRFPTLEAVPEKFNYNNQIEEVNLFWFNFGKFSKRYFKGNVCGKSFTRVSDKIGNLGIHQPEPKKGVTLNKRFSFFGRNLHFDGCNFKDWKEKCIRRITKECFASEMGDKKKGVLSEFSKRKDEIQLKEFYKKNYIIEPYKKKIFLLLGILRRIKINKKLFKKMEK